jgi:hypothetical protein
MTGTEIHPHSQLNGSDDNHGNFYNLVRRKLSMLNIWKNERLGIHNFLPIYYSLITNVGKFRVLGRPGFRLSFGVPKPNIQNFLENHEIRIWIMKLPLYSN